MTTLGTPASVSMMGLRIRRSRPSEYSAEVDRGPKTHRDRDPHRDHRDRGVPMMIVGRSNWF